MRAALAAGKQPDLSAVGDRADVPLGAIVVQLEAFVLDEADQ